MVMGFGWGNVVWSSGCVMGCGWDETETQTHFFGILDFVACQVG